MNNLPTRTNKGDNQAIAIEDVAVVNGLTIDGVPIYVETRIDDEGVLTLGSLVTVAKRGGHAYVVNSAPKTVADRPFKAQRIELGNGETVRPHLHEATNGDANGRNRCARYSAIVKVTSVTTADGVSHDVTGYIGTVIKDRGDSKNATGTKAGSLVGMVMFATEVDAAGWKHLKPAIG